MSKNNVRIAIRDSTDSHNVAFFDNKAGIKYKSANLHRFLAGSASILTIKYNSKDIDSIRSGCKLAFRYKNRDYWLNVMSFEKKGFEVELTAYSLGLELNNETRGEHKPANAMSIAEYVAYYDPEHALTIGVNEVSDKRIKLEWTGTDTILARLFSVANSFDAELDFNVELNDDYSLKRQVLNIYKKGNLGTNKLSQPVQVGKELKVINYSDNIKELRTAVRATGKDGLTIDGLNKKIYDDNKELLYYSSGMTVYAPQSRDRFPSVGKGSNDNWIVEDLGETQYETKEALWGYMYGEIQKKSLPEITYEVEGAIEAGIGDTQTLIDDIHFEPTLYVQARVSELEDDILTGKVTKSTFINFERKYSQIADILLKQVEALAEDAAPYIVRLTTDNGYNFKNGQGTSTITAKLEKYSKIVNAKWKWLINNSVVSETSSVKINASQVNGTLNVVAVAIVGGSEAAREYITFTNVNDGLQGPQGPQGDEGPKGDKGDTGNGIANTVITYGLSMSDTTEPATWSSNKPALVKGMYLWTRTVFIYTNGESTTSYQISYIAKDADATADIDKTKQELLEKLETVRDDSLAAVEEAKQELTTVSDDLSKAKTDLHNAVSAVDTKATNLQSDLSKAKQDLASQAQQLQAQANAQSELTKRVSSVEKTADGTKTTVSELSKTVAQNGKDIVSVTARTKVVEDDLSGTKTTLSQVNTTANSASQKTATLETGLNGLAAKFNSLSVGGANLFKGSRDFSTSNWINNHNGIYAEDYQGVKIFKTQSAWSGRSQYFEVKAGEEYVFSAYVKSSAETDRVTFYLTRSSKEPQAQGWVCLGSADSWGTVGFDLTDDYQRIAIKIKITRNGWMMPRLERFNNEAYLFFGGYKLERGNIATDYSPSEADIEQKVAEYKQTADQNYASLQTTVQNLNGTVQQNKTTAEQTAQGFKTRIESLETYKDGETTRASQYFELAKTETARQLTAERTAIAKDYVAKSTYTSDVTGIRNDLTATTTTANTTKTNLANYQASNDKAVANLQSNLQTANGNISSLKTKVEAVPGQITSAVSAVEEKIPTSIGGRNLWIQSKATGGFVEETLPDNHVTGQKKCYRIPNNKELAFNIEPDFSSRLYRKVTFSAWVKYENVVQGTNGWNKFNCFKHNLYYKNSSTGATTGSNPLTLGGFVGTSDWNYITYTYDYAANKSYDQLKTTIRFNLEGAKSGTAWVTGVKIEVGSIPSDYSPAPEDTESDINAVSSQIKQTADGMTLLATKTELNSAKTELQSGIATATSKADNAQSTANSNAQTISTHTTQISALNTGLSAKVSQSDFNTLSGRVTTAENNITAKANELSSKITSVEGKIPTSAGGRNLALGTSDEWSNPYTWFNGDVNNVIYIAKVLTSGLKVGDTLKAYVEVKYKNIVPAEGKTAKILTQDSGNVTEWNNGGFSFSEPKTLSGSGEIVFEITDTMRSDHLKNTYWNWSFRTNYVASGSIQFRLAKVEAGDLSTPWSPAPEDYDSKLATAQSEIKQTTDAITASVSSVQTAASNAQSTANTAVSKADAAQAGVNTLDNTTVKSASLTINADGIVMKAGKSTTDVANAIGSYFAVNQNAINLFADKINVKANMIVDGAITSTKIAAGAITADKIAANSINSSNIVSSGITANVIKGGVLQSLSNATNFELDTGKLFYNSNNTGVFRVEDGASTMGLKFSNTPITVNGTSRILSRVILGGDRRETSLDDGKWDQGGFTGIVAETINGVNSNQNEHADTLRVIGDNIYFTHSYDYDSSTGISAQGWKMETFSPFSSYPGNVVLKPYGVNYRQSDIITGDIRLDNGDGSGYWVRDCIRTLKRCFQHYLNGGTTSGAMNAIRDTLKDISGV
ncbi:Chromosome partition protein Smc [Streptococcus infantarius subsp. infantarius]|nr:Chromosome partition protein Smc [Streptococcus infantarius subsp. infantarius]